MKPWFFPAVLLVGCMQIGHGIQPVLLEPEDGSATIVRTPHFAWEAPEGAMNCEVEIATDIGFKQRIESDSIPALTGWYVCAKRLGPGAYHWRLRFVDALGKTTGSWTPARSLTIVEPKRILRVTKDMMAEQTAEVIRRLAADPHDVKLEFEKGRYVFKPGMENAIIALNKARDVVIEGNDSEFISQEPSAQFWKITDSVRVTVSGIRYGYDPCPTSHVRVLGIDLSAGTLDGEVLGGFDDTIFPREVNQMFCYAVSPENPRQIHPNRPGHTYLDPRKTEKIGDHRYRFHIRDESEKASLKQLQAGDQLVLPYRRWPAGVVARCSDFTFFDVENMGAEGSVFMGGGNSDMKFLGYLSRSSHPPLPGNAWVTGNDRRGPWIENCVFETLSDDGPNITGNLYLIAKQQGPKEFQLMTGPGYQDACWRVGDRLLFWNPQTGEPLAETEIEEVRDEKPGFGRKVIVTRDAPAGLSPGADMHANTQVYNLSCQNNGFVARNNRIVDGRRFGFNVKAINAVIEKNYFEGLASSAIYIENEPSGWEGIVGRNIIVQDNTMVNCGYGADAAGLKRGNIQVNLWRIRQPGDKSNESPWMGHRNIVIRNNHILDWESYGIAVDNVDGCRIENNELANKEKKDFLRKTNIGIWVRSVTKDVELRDNNITDQRAFEHVRQDNPTPRQ